MELLEQLLQEEELSLLEFELVATNDDVYDVIKLDNDRNISKLDRYLIKLCCGDEYIIYLNDEKPDFIKLAEYILTDNFISKDERDILNRSQLVLSMDFDGLVGKCHKQPRYKVTLIDGREIQVTLLC